jgi:hypothetical protein
MVNGGSSPFLIAGSRPYPVGNRPSAEKQSKHDMVRRAAFLEYDWSYGKSAPQPGESPVKAGKT